MNRKINVISEIGINHNGLIDTCKELIKVSKDAGADYAKIQKRNPDLCVPEAQKSKPKSTPWGEMTYLEYKHRVEFDETQIKELVEYAREIGIEFFASVWDLDSVEIMARYTNIGKIPSALITNLELCRASRAAFDTLIISTGMSTEEEIEACIEACNPDVIMHTNSTYPCPPEDVNLNYIDRLYERWGRGTDVDAEIGYSGHEEGLEVSQCAFGKGVTWVERHVTLDKTMWGSDQSASIEPNELEGLVRGARIAEKAMQYPAGPRMLFEKENVKRESLRGN